MQNNSRRDERNKEKKQRPEQTPDNFLEDCLKMTESEWQNF